MEQSRPDRQENNAHVENEAPVLEIVEIVFDPSLDRGIAAPAVHLSPARNPNFEAVARVVGVNVVKKLLYEIRAFRPGSHNTHVAPKHVEELRKFVEARSPQEDAERGPAWIVLDRPAGIALRRGRDPHGTEFQHGEYVPVEPDALLAEEYRPRRAQFGPHRDREHHGRAHHNRPAGKPDVEPPLANRVGQRFGGATLQIQQLQPPKLKQPFADEDTFAKVDDGADGHAEPLQAPHHLR